MKNNEIYLRRNRKILVEKISSINGDSTEILVAAANGQTDARYVAAFLQNAQSLGFTFSALAVSAFLEIPKDDFIKLADETIAVLKKMKKAHVKYSPMYPNFPEQVANASDATLYINAMIHYLGAALGKRIIPFYEENERAELFDFANLETISLGNIDEFNSIPKKLLASPVAISPSDRDDVLWFFQNSKDAVQSIVPDVVPNKENFALLVNLVKELGQDELISFLEERITVTTDILRVAVALNDGDVTLAVSSRFGKISRPVRRAMLKSLNGMTNVVEDMLRHKEEWKRLGEHLHPGEYKTRFPETFSAFEVLRKDLPFITSTSAVERAILNRSFTAALGLLSARPGDFARRLDHLLRLNYGDSAMSDSLVKQFAKVASKVSSNVLWQLRTHMVYRQELVDGTNVRIVTPKGNLTKMITLDEKLAPIDMSYVKRIIEICDEALRENYATKSALGKVYVDKNLDGFAIPQSLRNASRALKEVGRGSRIPADVNFPQGNFADSTIRLFTWWHESDTRTDLDLSVVFFDDAFKLKDSISYRNLRNNYSVHSGDFTSAPQGASEFVDVNVQKAREAGARYALVSVLSFTRQPFYELKECFAGVMLRQGEPQRGKVFDARTVQMTFDLTGESSVAVPLVFDLETGEMIWADASLNSTPYAANNVENNMFSLNSLAKAIVGLRTPNLYDLFVANVEARGQLVATEEEADTILGLANGYPNVSNEDILSEYL